MKTLAQIEFELDQDLISIVGEQNNLNRLAIRNRIVSKLRHAIQELVEGCMPEELNEMKIEVFYQERMLKDALIDGWNGCRDKIRSNFEQALKVGGDNKNN